MKFPEAPSVAPSQMETERQQIEHQESELFHEYLENLGLTESDLKNKRIVDIGAGMRIFAGHCIRTGINPNVYSVEPNDEVFPEERSIPTSLWTKDVWDAVDRNTARATREALPYEDASFDLALVHGALAGGEDHMEGRLEEMKTNIDSAFDEIARIINAGGEARLFPFYGERYDSWRKPWKDAIDEKLRDLVNSKKYTVTIEPIRERPSAPGQPPEIISRIIIRRTPQN
jgi:SAM-dependent methyltransferase